MLSYTIVLLLGPLFVEVLGYVWHRFVSHEGWLGDRFRHAHFLHHHAHYPASDLHPDEPYKDAKDKSWHYLAYIMLVILGILIALEVLHMLTATLFATSALLYSRNLVSAMHKAFHDPRHRLNHFTWFKHLVQKHDIHHQAPGNYGIVFFGFDRLFGSHVTHTPKDIQDLFPGYQK